MAQYTTGEIAKLCGVSVRTVQFYDQQKLLAPSAKGPQNRRLYSKEDERELQRILVLKFLGNSLSDIRKVLAHKLEGMLDIRRGVAAADELKHTVAHRLRVYADSADPVRSQHTQLVGADGIGTAGLDSVFTYSAEVKFILKHRA